MLAVRKFTLGSCLLLAVLVALLGLSHGHDGATVSMDSLTYLHVARSVSEGRGITAPDHQLDAAAYSPVTLWPPLYPVVLAALCPAPECSAPELRQRVPWLNGLLLLLAAILFYQLCQRLVAPPQALVASVTLVVLPAFQIMYLYVWSEALFIPLLLASFACLQRHLSRPDWRWLGAALVLVALATYSRYTGVAFALGLVLSLLLFVVGPPVQKLRTAVCAGLVYSLLITPLLLRNFLLVGHLSGGERGLPGLRLLQDSQDLLWQLVIELYLALPVVALVWLALLLVLAGLAWHRPRMAAVPATARQDWAMPLLWAACYLGFLLVSRSLQRVDLDTRMLGVVLPFLLLLVVACCASLRARLPAWGATLPLATLALCALVSGLYTHGRLVENLRTDRAPGLVHGMEYYSITEPRFDLFADLARRYRLGEGDLVLTDIPRPQILSYFFGAATVKAVPVSGGELDAERAGPLLQPGLLVVLHSPQRQQEFLDLVKASGVDARVLSAGNSWGQFLVADFPPP